MQKIAIYLKTTKATSAERVRAEITEEYFARADVVYKHRKTHVIEKLKIVGLAKINNHKKDDINGTQQSICPSTILPAFINQLIKIGDKKNNIIIA